MCDTIQSAVIHSSTATQWDLAGAAGAGGELWGGVPYQAHPALWDAAHPQYQPELFGFGPDFWAGQRSSAGASR